MVPECLYKIADMWHWRNYTLSVPSRRRDRERMTVFSAPANDIGRDQGCAESGDMTIKPCAFDV